MSMDRTCLPVLVGVALGLLAGCFGEAPHDNPLDPNADSFRDEGAVVGRVIDRTGQPLADAEVRLVAAPVRPLPELATRTGLQGTFAFQGVPAAPDYRLQVRKDAYEVAEMEALAVRAGETVEPEPLRLNALPLFAGVLLRTLHVSRWWPQNDRFLLAVDAAVTDADGAVDVDQVWLEIPELNYTVPLTERAAGQFDRLVEADSLPGGSLQALLGRTLRLRASDREGAVTESPAQQLARVIEATPVAVAPQGLALLPIDRPTLSWEPFPAAFPFTYRIDVFRDEVNRPVKVASLDVADAGATSIQLPTSLATGPYFWTVTVVDAFGNESRSKEAGFRIP